MGRAIVRQPRVFLMDEPLSNLDAKLRVATRSEIAALQRRLAVTTVYVTHDQVEAMTMGDRVAVMKDGVLQQVDVPSVLYDSPANAFVAGLHRVARDEPDRGHHWSGRGHDRVDAAACPEAAQEGRRARQVTVGVRPESVGLAGDGSGLPASSTSSRSSAPRPTCTPSSAHRTAHDAR